MRAVVSFDTCSFTRSGTRPSLPGRRIMPNGGKNRHGLHYGRTLANLHFPLTRDFRKPYLQVSIYVVMVSGCLETYSPQSPHQPCP